MKIVLVSCVKTVYICIGLKKFSVICDEFLSMNIYIHMEE
jgi:hypothetical protein